MRYVLNRKLQVDIEKLLRLVKCNLSNNKTGFRTQMRFKSVTDEAKKKENLYVVFNAWPAGVIIEL